MTIFIRSIAAADKKEDLALAVIAARSGKEKSNVYTVNSDVFSELPGSPFAYWASQNVRSCFEKYGSFESDQRSVKQGLATADDFRFVRLQWEVVSQSSGWMPYAKGGASKPFYQEVLCLVRWKDNGVEIKNNLNERGGIRSNVWMLGETEKNYFTLPGVTWPLRGYRFSSQAVPEGCIFSVAGKMAFPISHEKLATLAIFNSTAFDAFVMMLAGRVVGAQYEVGLIQRVPFPLLDEATMKALSELAKLGWRARYNESSLDECSKAFFLPLPLRYRVDGFETHTMKESLSAALSKIDEIAFGLYGFSDGDKATVSLQQIVGDIDELDEQSEDEDGIDETLIDSLTALGSWAVGVAFARFDLRLATGEREQPAFPEPFDELPIKSPGMLPDGAAPFHVHAGILVDDQGHPHDLARLVEEVLSRVDVSVPDDIRRWLQRDFFAFHLQRYSKSRRKAPIYWPLSTASGGYTLWLYYPFLNNQTLFTAVNDFLDGPNGKLTQVSRECTELRMKGSGRSSVEEKQYESLQTFEQELTDLRDTLLKIAPTYQPNHDDGVQITAAPLWQLFRHKPWQKVLKDTWTKLEKGDYDWAHLAMSFWPDRVREKCKADKSLAIAHGLEDLYVEPEAASKKTRTKKKAGADE